jgi:paraquat-inducible protein B
MSDTHDQGYGNGPPDAHVKSRRPFPVVWIIPIVALAIAAFLGWRAVYDRGPLITITFLTGDGLTAGQTRVQHKAVDLGTVRSISLSKDMTHVEVRVQMRREATPELTENARFWVVRPRFTGSNISGLDTLLSGAYIELDPGAPGGEPKREFVGLEVPPAVRSDEPGRTFLLKADRIGSLASGSPVFFHDIDVGELLSYDIGPQGEGITMHVFVRAPFDKYVHQGTRFWNASGVGIDLGAEGVRVQLQSLTAVLSGGIAFDTEADARATPVAPMDASFPLFKDETTARTASYSERFPYLIYFDGSVRGLAPGAALEFQGIQIGVVTSVGLDLNPIAGTSRAVVRVEVQPERVLPKQQFPDATPLGAARALAAHGMRAVLQTGNLLTGQKVVSLAFVPSAPAAEVREENGVAVLPSINAGFDNITAGLSQIVDTLNRLPLEQIVQNLNETLQSVHDIANGPELRQTLQSMAATMASVNDLANKANSGATPMLKRLPEIAQSLQATVDRANRLVGSADSGYGANSQFRRDLERLLGQVSDTARSVRVLSDYLDQHPEALIRGRDSGR